MMELTKDRLQQIVHAAGLEPWDYEEVFDGITTGEIVMMARQLLASMEQEPVYQVLGDGSWTDYSKQQLEDLLESKPSTLFRVAYAAPQLPQPAVVVSEAQSKKLFDEWSGGDGALGDLRASGVPDEFISMLKEFSLATWDACREAMLKHSAPFIVTSDQRMMEMPKNEDIDTVAAMIQGAEPDFREISYSSTKHFRENAETSTNSTEPSQIDHGYRHDCECSGCIATARICAELAVRSPVIPDCWCRTCRPLTVTDMRFVACPECGNKRCPHANDHRNVCTGSNEPGQEGSAYPEAPQQEVK